MSGTVKEVFLEEVTAKLGLEDLQFPRQVLRKFGQEEEGILGNKGNIY